MLQWNGFLQTQKVNVVCRVYSVRHSIDVMSNWKGESLICLNQKSSQCSSDLVLLTKTTCSCDMPIYCLETQWKTLHFIFTRKDNSAFKLLFVPGVYFKKNMLIHPIVYLECLFEVWNCLQCRQFCRGWKTGFPLFRADKIPWYFQVF